MDKSLQCEVKKIQLHELMNITKYTIFVTITVASLLTFVLWEHMDHTALSYWYAGIILLSLYRYTLFFIYKQINWEQHDIITFSKFNLLGIGLSGLMLGLSIILFFPYNSYELQIFIYLALAGMAAGAVGTYSMRLEAFVIYTTPISFMLFYRLITSEYISVMLLGIISILFLGAIFSSVRQVNYYVTRHMKTVFENRKLIAELAIAKEHAESANHAKSMFLTNMSHELRTPLNAVLGFSQIMRQSPGRSSEDKLNLEIINKSGEHLLHLINNILDISKIEEGHMVLDFKTFNLETLIRDILNMMRIRAKAKDIELIYEQSGKIPHFVIGDASKLRQILINLLSNAIKFTNEGHVTLKIYADIADVDRISLMFEVKDSGIGINPQEQEHIFQPFKQLMESTEQKGTGLGLAITRKFVELMGGELSVESTQGIGSKFSFNIYVQPAEEEIVSDKQNNNFYVVGIKASNLPLRILVADDHLENQLLLKKLLEDTGFQVRIAENGLKCIELFKEWHPHFIWMDIRMPVINGTKAIREIRKLPGGGTDVKIAALTAVVFQEQEKLVKDVGADDFVHKPYNSEAIFECMAHHLDIEYIYENKEINISVRQGTYEMLMSLPKEQLMALESAVLELDIEQTKEVIDHIKKVNPELADGLQKLLNNLNFNRLKNILIQNKEI